MIEGGVALQRRQDADRYAQADGNQQCRHRQLDRRREAREQVDRNGAAGEQALAEIAFDQTQIIVETAAPAPAGRNPYWRRSASICSWVARSPAISAAGSAGMTCEITKVTATTPITVSALHASRRAAKRKRFNGTAPGYPVPDAAGAQDGAILMPDGPSGSPGHCRPGKSARPGPSCRMARTIWCCR